MRDGPRGALPKLQTLSTSLGQRKRFLSTVHVSSAATFVRTKPLMMRVATVALTSSLLATPANGSSSNASSQDASVVEELRRLTQENLDAIAPGHVEVWRRNSHELLVHVDENGIVRDKVALLAELQPLPAGLVGQLEIDKFQVVFLGDVAIATHEDREFLNYYGQVLRSSWRTIDTWVRTPDGWRLLAEQTLALQVDPPASALSRDLLCAYNGTYRLTPAITTTATCNATGLNFKRSDRPDKLYMVEIADVFFVPGEPRTRRVFQRNEVGEITGFVDRREGHDIRWDRLK